MDTIQPIQPNQLSTSPFSYSLAGQDNIISLGGSIPNPNAISSTSGDYVTFLNANDQGQSVDLYLKVGLGNVLEFSNDGVNYFQVSGLALSGSKTVSIDLGSGNDSLHVDSSLVGALQSTGTQIDFNGGTGNNTLFGPNLDATWNITGQNSGNVDGINFSNVANLKAADNNYATFDFAPGGSLSGTADGGSGNLGTLEIQGGSYTSEQYVASGPHSGEIILGTQTGNQTIQYAGLAPIIDNSNTTDRVFTSTSTSLVSNQIVLGAAATSGQMTISSNNGSFESITFLDPSNSLTINGGGGNDTVTVNSLDPNFKGSLDIEESNNSASSVTFAQNLSLNGGSLTVNAASITVNPNVTISTQDLDTNGNSIHDSGSVSLNATNTISEDIFSSDSTAITLGSNSNILAQSTNTTYKSGNISLIATDTGNRVGIEPFGYSAKNVSITLNSGDEIRGANVKITSTATDLTDLSSLPSSGQSLLKPFTQGVSQAFNFIIPGSVMVRGAHTSVTLNSDTIIGSGTVTIESTTAVDSSVQAVSTLNTYNPLSHVAAAYGQADGQSSTSVLGNSQITATGDVDIESSTTTTDNVLATVYANSGALNQAVDPNTSAASAAVANSNTISHVLVDSGVTVNSSSGNINVTATGKTTSSAKATTAVFVDGRAGLGMGLNLENSSILATVNGKLTAAGNNVDSGQAIDLSNVNSGNNTITLQNNGFQTGDVVQYNTSGAAIGGLQNNQDYYVISLPNTPNVIQLSQGLGLELNNSGVNANAQQTLSPVQNIYFDPTTSVNTSNNEISIPNASQIFVTGQHISYSDPTGDPIGGLGSGGDYYVILNSDGSISLALNPTDAANGVAIPLTSTGDGTDVLTYTINTPVTFNPSGSNIQDNIITIPNHGLTTGELVQYNVDPTISSTQNIQINNTFDPNAAVNLTNSEITLQNVDTFDPNAAVNLTNSEITIDSHGFQTGEEINYAANYLGQPGNAIGGLINGTNYYVIVIDQNTVQLADSYADAEAGKFIQFTSLGTLGDVQALQAITDNGLKTGEAVTYSTNYMGENGNAIGGLTNGQTYYAIYVNDDTVQLADSYGDAEAGKFIQFTSLGTGDLQALQTTQSVTVGDTPIDGLEDGNDYYVSVVDANHIRLADSLADAENAAPIAIDPTVATGNQTLALVPDGNTTPPENGITVSATLTASDKVSISGKTGSNPKIKDLIANITLFPLASAITTFSDAKGALTSKVGTTQNVKDGQNDKNEGWSIGAAIGVNYVTHDVEATVGSTAVLQSSKDVNVNATTTETIQLIVDSSTSKDNGGDAVSVSLGVGIYQNQVDASVLSNAVIDASGTVNVKSNLSYPFLFEPDTEFNPSDTGTVVANSIYFATTVLTDGKFGIPTTFFNSFVTSRNKGKVDKTTNEQNTGTGWALSFDYTDYNNQSEATIGSGVQINQDQAYQTPTQAVNVNAQTNMTLLNAAGVINLDLSIDNLIKAKKTSNSAEAYSFYGNNAQNGYGGGAVAVDLNNTTIAEIDADAKVHTGTSGAGLTVDAVEEVLMLELAQSGGNADKIGVAGSVSVITQTNRTLAQLASGVQVTGGLVSLSATDSTTHINLVGSVQLGKNVGIGLSEATDILTRSTQAIIGNEITSSNNTPGSNGTSINSTGSSTGVTLNAESSGNIVSLAYAGAKISTTTFPTSASSAPADAGSASGAAGAAGPAAGAQSGLGIAGDASVNIVNDVTRAYINDNGNITADSGAVDISSTDNTWIASAAGAYALSISVTPGTTTTGIAGSYAENDLTGDTEAFIAGVGTTIFANSLSITSLQEDFIVSITGGIAVEKTSTSSTSVAGSVSYNNVQDTTLAYVSGATVALDDGATISATDNSEIWSLAGAVGYGASGGYGVSIGLNIIGTANQPTTTKAYITGSQFTVQEGNVDISAKNNSFLAGDPRIIAIVASYGSSGQTSDDSISGAGMVAVNIIQDDVEAYVSSSSRIDKNPINVNPLNVNITSEDDSWIVAVGGAVGKGQKGGLGAAVSYNQVADQIRAYIDDSQVIADGSLDVNAESKASITGGTLGVGVSTNSTGLALAGSASINQITDTIDAHIDNGSYVVTDGSGVINAEDNSLNVSVTGGIAAGGKTAVGAAVSYNLIQNTIESYIDNSIVNSTNGSLQDTATDSALLISIAVGGSGADQFAFGGSVDVNSIANDTDAHISNNSQVSAQGSIDLAAAESSSLYSVSGGIAISQGGSAVGAAIAYNYMGGSFDPTNPDVINKSSAKTNGVTSYIDNSKVTAGGNLSVTGGFQPPASPLSNNSQLLSSTTTTFDPTSAVNTSDNEITLSSTSGFTSGQGVVYNNNGGTSIGGLQNGGIYYVVVLDSTHIELASTSDEAVNIANGTGGSPIQLTSAGSGTGHYFTSQTVNVGEGSIDLPVGFSSQITAVTVGGSKANNFALGGAVSLNFIHNDVNVYISDTSSSQQVYAGGTLSILANDTSQINSGAGGIGISASGGAVGAGISYADISDSLITHTDNNAGNVSAQQIQISSTSSATIYNVAFAGAYGDTFTLGGSVSTNTIANTTKAYILNSTNISSTDGITIQSQDNSTSGSYAGTLVFGAKTGIGASIATNDISNAIASYISGSTVTSSIGNVNITATSTGETNAIAVGGSGATNFALGGSVTVNDISNTEEADINNGSNVQSSSGVSLQASDDETINSLAGQVSGSSGSTAVGAGVATNDISNETIAVIDSSTVIPTAGTVTLSATSNDGIESLAIGGTGASSFAAGGAVTVNNITNTIQAGITGDSNASTIQANGNVNLTATDNSIIQSLAGQVSISKGTSIGASVATNTIGNTISADIENAQVTTSTGTVSLSSTSTDQINSIAVGGAGGSSFAAGGSVTVNNITNSEKADISDGSTVKAPGTISLQASDGETINSLAGQISGSTGNGAVGAGVSTNNIGDKTIALIDSSTVTSTAGAVTLSATSNNGIESLAIGGAGADSFAAGGAVTVNNISNTIQAGITGTNSQSNVQAANGDVDLTATDSSTIQSLGGEISFSASGAGSIGVSAASNTITNNISADISNAQVTASNGGVNLSATSTESIDSIAASGAITTGGTISADGAVTVNTITNTIEAEIVAGSVVKAEKGTVNLTAEDNSTIKSLAGQVAVGGTASVGVSSATNTISDKTIATIDDSQVTSASSVTLSATSQDQIESIAVGASGASSYAAGGSITVNNITNTEKATIADRSNVQAQGAVSLQAADGEIINSLAGEISGSTGNGAVGAGVSTNNIGDQTIVLIDSSTVTSTTGGVTLTATSNNGIESLAIGGTGASSFAAGGAVTLNKIDSTIQAGITGDSNASIVQANGNVNLTALDNSTIQSLAGQVSVAGDGSIGAAVATNTISNDISAGIGNAQVTASNGGINLSATSTEGINSIAAGGAGAGDFAAGGAVTLNTITNTIEAEIITGSVVKAEKGTANLIAEDNSTIKSLAGQVSGGGTASVGASVATNTISNQTIATIDDSQVTSSSTVSLSATSQDEIDSIAAGAAGAGTFALGGSVTVNNITNTEKATIADGSNVQAQGTVGLQASDTSTINSLAGQVAIGGSAAIGVAVSTNNIGNQVIANIDSSTVTSATGDVTLTATTTDAIESLAIGGSGSADISLAGATTLNKITNTIEAGITGTKSASTVQANGNVNITATDGSTIQSLAGQVSVSGGGSIGAAVATNTITNNISADISNAQVTASNGGVNLSATSTEGISSIAAGGSGAGTFAAGGAVTLNTITNTIESEIAAGSILNAKNGSVGLTAKDNSTIKSLAGQVSGGGTASVGASVATNTISNQTIATIDNSQVTSSSTVSLSATSQDEIDSIAAGAAGAGTFALGGSVTVNNITNTEKATIADGSNVQAQGTVGLQASDTSTINSLAGQVAIGGSAAIGVAVSTNNIGNQVIANIDSSTVTSATGDVTLTATTTDAIESLAIGGSGSADVSLAGATTLNKITNTIEAGITGTKSASTVQANGNVNITATDGSTINSLAGQVSVSGGGSIGAAVATNTITNNISADISNAQVTASNGGVNLSATSTEGISSIAAGGSGAGAFAAGGAVTLNTITNTIESEIAAGSILNAQNGSVGLTAKDNSTIKSLAGQVSGGGTASVGASVATNTISNQTIATIDDSQVTSSSVNLSATSQDEIDSIAAGAAGAGTFALGGSVTVNNITNTEKATIADGSNVQAQGAVGLQASDTSTINSLAGQVAIGGSAAIGVAVSTNNIANQVIANIDPSIVASATGDVILTATSTDTIESLGIGGSGSADVSLAGATTLNKIANTIQASITNGSTVQANGNVDLTATDNSTIKSLAGQVSISGGGSIGAAVATNKITNQIIANIDNSQVTSTSGNVSLSATSSGEIDSTAAGGSGAGLFAAGGAVTVNQLGSTIEADIANGANVQATQGSVLLTASNNSTINSLAGQITIAGGAAIGAAVAVNNSGDTITAYISDSTVTSANQVNASATNTATIESASIGASVSGEVSLTGSVSVNNINNTIDAHIFNSTISVGSLDVSSADTSTINSLAGQISISFGAAAIGAAVAYNNISNTITAYAENSQITTANNALLNASSAATIETIAAGGSVSGGLSLAGSTAVNQMSNQISAYIQGGRLTAQGSVGILANSANTMTTNGGTFAAGLAGIGGTVVVDTINNSTRAYINQGIVDALGYQTIVIPTADGTGGTATIYGLGVIATSQEGLNVKIGTGAIGGLGLAATIIVNSFTDTTQAFIQESAINAFTSSTNEQQSVYIKALNQSSINDEAGSVAVGLVGGVGATIDVTTIDNATTAFIGPGQSYVSVNANKDVVVEATTQRTLQSKVVAGSAGLGLGVSGAVYILNIGSASSPDDLQAASDTQSKVDQELAGINGMANNNIQTNQNAINNSFSASVPTQVGTTAYISGKVGASGDIIVTANETTNVGANSGDIVVGAAAIGGILGAGGAVAVVNVTNDVSAYVTANSILAGGNISIQANGTINGGNLASYAGTAGLVGLGAAVTELTSNNNTSAYIGAGTVINQAHNINVNADSSSTLGTDAEGASFGAIAAGAVISSASETGTTQAYLDSGVQIQNADNLTVTSTVNDTVSATDQAAAGGLGSGTGTIPTATVSPTIKAYLGNNDNIQVTQNVQVSSNVAVGGSAYAKGINIGGITVGVSEATVNSTPNIDTHLGSGLTIQAANVSVTSNLGQPATVPGDTTFNPSTAVNNSNGTITFDSPDGLTTGQEVVYLNGGGNSIGGLRNNQGYNVIVVNSNTIELGSQFDSSQVDTANNTITFSNGHDFQNGDKVIYEATSGNVIGGLVSGDTYYIKVINATTVQLTSTYADATTATDTVQVGGISAVSNNAIDYSNNAFQNGDLVNYQLRTAQFSVYDSSNAPSSTIPTDANGPEDVLNLNTQLLANSVIHSYGFDTNHAGFANGDQVIYTCTSGTNSIGGLVSGQKYYVEVVDADDFQLSLTLNGPAVQITSAANGAAGQITAVGLDTLTPGTTSDFTYTRANSNSIINLANNGFSTGDVVQYKVVSGGTALSGLTSGQDYYVIEVDSNHLELATSLTNAENGTAITLGTSTSQQQLTLLTPTPLAANTNYYVVGETGNSFQLATTAGGPALTLITTGLTGTGSDFIFDRENVVALTSTGTGEQNLHFALDNSTATGTAQQLSPGTSVSIPTPTNYVFSAYSQASSGSLVGVNATQTTINARPTITTYVGNQASITTSGNFTVTSYSDVQLSGGTTSDTDGAIAVGASNIDTTLTNNNSVCIGNGATIQAQGDVSITSQSDHSVSISGYGSAGAIIPVANATANATITDQTITTINDNASITATGDILVQSSGNTYANTEAKTDGGGLVPYAHSRSTLNIADDNETNIDAATLTGRNVTVQTVINQLDVQARTDAEGAGLIGLINAVTNLNLTGTDALVNIGSGALLKGDYINLNAQYQNFSAQSLSYASCDGLGGDTDSTANSTIPVTTKVQTDANSTLETTYLNVTSDFGSVYHNTYAHSKLAWSITINFGFFSITITMDFGGPSTSDNFNPSSNTDFNSQVTLFASQENPFLTVAQNGQITSSANVTTTNDGTNIVVNNILNNSVGSVTFNMPYSTGGTFTDHGVYTIADPAFDTVNIQNYSNENLIINNIQTINTGAIPTISYSNVNSIYNPPSQPTNLNLPNPLLTNPTVVTIDNFGNSNLILAGIINNPHDRTVLFSGGSILSQGTQEDIITRDLTMDAQTGSIGTNGQRIAIQLDQGYSPVTASVPSSDTYLSVEAATSDYLNLTAKALDNNPLTVDVTTMTATSGDVNLNIGQSTNGNGNNISALYQFIDPLNLDLNQQIVAGGNITINAGTTTTNIDGKTNFLSSTGILSIATGGYIEIANQSAELNVNQAISSGDAVTLTGAGDITLLNNAVVQSAGDTDLTAVNNLLFSDGSSLTSGNNVNLSAGNTFQLNATATITASNNATIYDNYTNPSAGALFNLYGWIYAKGMSIYGGAGDTNTFNIFRLAANTNLYTDASDNIVNIGSSQAGFNGTKDIKNQINLYDGATNNTADTLNVDDSGDTSSTVGVLTDTTLTGLGMGSGIYYSGFEVLNINLGQTNNNFTILNTSATTNINGNNANNTFQVGPSVDAQGNVLDQTVNGTNVPGTNLLGTSNVTNITTGSGTNTYTINRNTGVLNINSGSGTNNFVVNTPVSNGKLLANAQVNLVGNVAGKNNLTVNGSTLTTIQNNVSSINVVNSRLITLVNFLNPIVNSGTTSTGSSSGLLNRTLSGTSNSGTGGGSSTVSPLLNRRLH